MPRSMNNAHRTGGESRTDKLWTWVRSRRKRSFTIEDAVRGSDIPETSARRFIGRLKEAGIVVRVADRVRERDGRSVACYRLAVDQGPATPNPIQQAAKGDQRRNERTPVAVWTAVRIQREFVWESLIGALNAGYSNYDENPVRLYLQQVLVRGGYVQAIRPVKGGQVNWRYRLVRNTGPQAPVRRNGAVWDPNLKEMVAVRAMEGGNV